MRSAEHPEPLPSLNTVREDTVPIQGVCYTNNGSSDIRRNIIMRQRNGLGSNPEHVRFWEQIKKLRGI
jgi:hypothetical protein